MPRIVFFAPFRGRSANDNRTRLPRAFCRAGWEAVSVEHESLALDDRQLSGIDRHGRRREIDGAERFFILGFGAAASFLDRMQMLALLDETRFVNTPSALIRQHGKVSLIIEHPDIKQPESHLSNDPAALAGIVASGGEWIGKPPAGSFGRDVFRLQAEDGNARAILEHLTRDGRYALLQRRVPMERGEKRALIAGGEIIGAYGKTLADHRGNVDAGARPGRTELTAEESETVVRLAGRLVDRGIGFAAVDLAWPYVLEVNVANPGWLQTYETLTGEDLSPAVVAALTANADGAREPRVVDTGIRTSRRPRG